MFYNVLQLLDLSNTYVLIVCLLSLLLGLTLIVWHALTSGITTEKIRPSKNDLVLISLSITCSGIIYWNSSQLPNMAWDSWMVWVGKADQWINHGLSIEINQLEAWAKDSHSVYNAAAHYPDGLSLIYFLPKLITSDYMNVTGILYLFAFVMITLLLLSRLDRLGAPFYLQLLMLVVLFTTPFINNHLMIQGYADIWMSMFIALIMLTFIDFHEKRDWGVGITLIAYLLMLPMLKIEGWIWLALFVIAHLMVKLMNHKHKNKIVLLTIVTSVLFLFLGGINISLLPGNIIINTEKIEIFNLINSPIQFTNINESLLTGFFWQYNWSFIWVGLPFLLIYFVTSKHNKASQISHVFFTLALLCFMFLFYFTDASKWAQDLTALNRIVLQLTLSYLFLLFVMLTKLRGVRKSN